MQIEDKYRWIIKFWRPAMAWSYFSVCLFDFLFAPIGWPILQALLKLPVITPWQPITLQSGGLYHVAMGTIVGVASWARTVEKVQLMKSQAAVLNTNDPETIGAVQPTPPPTP